jgi:hypothetical protein
MCAFNVKVASDNSSSCHQVRIYNNILINRYTIYGGISPIHTVRFKLICTHTCTLTPKYKKVCKVSTLYQAKNIATLPCHLRKRPLSLKLVLLLSYQCVQQPKPFGFLHNYVQMQTCHHDLHGRWSSNIHVCIVSCKWLLPIASSFQPIIMQICGMTLHKPPHIHTSLETSLQ